MALTRHAAIFSAQILSLAKTYGCTVHEETNADGESRFSAILPDTRLVSCQKYQPRQLALTNLCFALRPYLEKYDQEKADAADGQKTKLTEPRAGDSLPA